MAVVDFEKREEIAYITINRPEARNAFDGEVTRLLMESFREFDADAALRVAILTGAGDKAFCAGADLKTFEGGGSRERQGGPALGITQVGGLLPHTVGTVSKPTIAAINGYCLAGGLEIAMACDIRIASETATFGCPEVKWNLLHGYGALRLPQAIPMAVAMEMMLTGEFIDAQEALRIGLVSKVVAPGELMAKAEEIAHKITANAPIAVRVTKELAYRGLSLPLEDGLRLYGAYSRIVYATEDTREGPRAFAEKRTPQFKGR